MHLYSARTQRRATRFSELGTRTLNFFPLPSIELLGYGSPNTFQWLDHLLIILPQKTVESVAYPAPSHQ
jgi:hypothetical protein